MRPFLRAALDERDQREYVGAAAALRAKPEGERVG